MIHRRKGAIAMELSPDSTRGLAHAMRSKDVGAPTATERFRH